MWIKLSTKHIFPGLKLVEEMGLITRSNSEAGMAEKLQRLDDWCIEAQRGVQAIAGKVIIQIPRPGYHRPSL